MLTEHYCVATNLTAAKQLELQDRLFADASAWEELTADGQELASPFSNRIAIENRRSSS